MNWPEFFDILLIGCFFMLCILFIFRKLKKIFISKKKSLPECEACTDKDCKKSAKGDCQPVEIKFHR